MHADINIFLLTLVLGGTEEYLLRTKIVRGKNMSRNRITPVALPVQNHGAGDAFKLCDTTLDAYSKRLVAAAACLSALALITLGD